MLIGYSLVQQSISLKPKLIPEEVREPEKVPQKVFDEVVVSEPEPERLPDKMPEIVPERRPPGKAEVKEKISEKVPSPERKVEEIPKTLPEEVPEKVKVKPPEEKVPEKVKVKPPEEKVPEKPVKVPQKKTKEERIPEKKLPVEEVKPERVSKKPKEMISADKPVPTKTPEKVSEAKPKREVEEILPKAATGLVKIEQRKGAQKIQEVSYWTEKASPMEEVWEQEVLVEEHTEVFYDDEVAPEDETIILSSEVDGLSTAERPSPRDKKSELRAAEKRVETQKILKGYVSEEVSSAEKVMEQEEEVVEEKDNKEIIGKSIKSLLHKEILSTMQEPDEESEISGEKSVTNGSMILGVKTGVIPKTKEMVKTKKGVIFQDKPTEQKSQVEEFSVRKIDSPTVSVKIKDITKATKDKEEASRKEKTKDESPEILVKAVSDQRQKETCEADSEKKEGIITQGFKEKPKSPVELLSMTDSKPLAKDNLQRKLKHTEQEEKPENIEITSKTQQIDSSELVEQTEEVSSKLRIVKSVEADEKPHVTEDIHTKTEVTAKPKSAKQKTLAEKPVRPEIGSQSSQSSESQCKEGEFAVTEKKLLKNVSHVDETKVEEIQSGVSKDIPKKEKDKVDSLKKKPATQEPKEPELDITNKELQWEEIPEKLTRTEEHFRESEELPDELRQSKEVFKKKIQPLIQKEETVEKTGDFDSFQSKAVMVKEKEIKQSEQGRTEGKASDIPVMEVTPIKEILPSEKLPKSTRELQPESIRSKVVTLKDKLVKISPMEGTTEMKPNREDTVSKRDIPSTKPIHSKEREQALKESKDVDFKVQPETVTAEDMQQTIPLKEVIKTRQEQTERKASTPVLEETYIKSSTEQEAPKRGVSKKEKGQTFAKTEECAVKDVPSKLNTRKDPTSKTEKGKEAILLEATPQIKEVPLKDNITVEVQSEVREDKVDKLTPTEEKKTKTKQSMRTSSIKEKEKQEAISQKKEVAQKQKLIKGEVEDFQSEVVRITDKTVDVTPSKVKQATTEEQDEISPTGVRALSKEEKIERKSSVESKQLLATERAQTTFDTEIKQGKVQSKTVTAEDKLSKVAKTEKLRKQEQLERQAPVVDLTEETPKESQTEKKLKLAKPEEAAIESIQSDVTTVKDKYSKVLMIKDTTETQRKPSVTDVGEINDQFQSTIAEDVSKKQPTAKENIRQSASSKEAITEPEVISPKKEEVMQGKSQMLQKKPKKGLSTPVSVVDDAEKHEKIKEYLTELATADTEIDTTQKESVSPQEPAPKMTKPQDILVEQDQLKISTVKDKTFKVSPLKQTKPTQEQMERKVSLTPAMEETSKDFEIEAVPEKHVQIKEADFAQADKENDVSEDVSTISPKELLSQKERRQKLAKAKEVADKKIPSKFVTVKDKTGKVTPTKHRTPEEPAKMEEIITEHAAIDKDINTTENKSVSLQEAQQKFTKPQQITVEQHQLRVSTVKDTTFKVTSLKETKSTQEQMERKVSLAPMMEATSKDFKVEAIPEKHVQIKEAEFAQADKENYVSEDISPKELPSQKERQERLAKTKQFTDKEIPSEFVKVEDKTEKVTSIKDGTPKAPKQQIKRKVSDKLDTTYTKSLEEQDTRKKIDGTEKTGNEEIAKPELSSSNEETPKIKKLQKLPKTVDIIDEKFQRVVVPIIDKKSQIPPAEEKKTKQEQEQLLRVDTAKETVPEETIKGDTPELVCPKVDKKEERPKSAKSKKISVEVLQARTVRVSDEYGSVTPYEATEIKQEQVKRKTSVLPLMEEAAGKPVILKDKDFPQQTISSDGKDITSGKEKEIAVEEISSNSVPVKGKTDKVAPIEKKTLKRQDQIDSMASEATEANVTFAKSLVEEDAPEKYAATKRTVEVTGKEDISHFKRIPQKKVRKSERDAEKDKTDKFAQIEEKKTRQEQTETKVAVTPEMEITAEKPDHISQEKLVETHKRTVQAIKDKTVKTKPTRKEEGRRNDSVTPSKEWTAEEIQSQTFTVKDEYGCVTPFEVTETKHKRVERKFSVSPLIEATSEKILTVKDAAVQTDSSENITVEQVQSKANIIRDKPEKVEVTQPLIEQEYQEQLTISDKTSTVLSAEEMKTRKKQTETKAAVYPEMELTKTEILMKKDALKARDESEHISQVGRKERKETTKTEKRQKSDKTSEILDEDTHFKKSLKEKEQRSGKDAKTTVIEIQSKTVTVKDEYGSVAPFEVNEAKQEKVERKFSVAPVMEVASEKSQILKDGDVISDTLQRFVIPDKLVKDIASRQEDIYEQRDVSLKRNEEKGEMLSETENIIDQQIKSKIDLVKDKTEKVSHVKEKMPDRKKQRDRKTTFATEPEVTYRHTLVEQDTPENLTLMDKSTIILPVEHMKSRPKLTETKAAVSPATEVTDTAIKVTQSKKSESEEEQKLGKGAKTTVEEIQSKTVTVKDEYSSVAPFEATETKQEQVDRTVLAPVMQVASEKHLIAEYEDVKSGTLQRLIIPDKQVKDIASRKENVYTSGEVSHVRHSQSPDSSKESVQIVFQKQEIIDKDIQSKELTNQFETDKTKQKQQKAEVTAAANLKTQETLTGESAKTDSVVTKHEEVKYDSTSPKKPDSLKNQGQVTVEGIQSRTDTVKDVLHSVTTTAELKQEQIERKSSRTPVMDVAYEKPLIMREGETILDTPQRYITPDDLVKDTTKRKKETYMLENISLKKDKATKDNSQRLDQTEEVQESKSKVEILGDKTTTVTPFERHKTRPDFATIELLPGEDISEKYTYTQIEFPKQTLHETNKSDFTVEEIKSKIVTVKDKTAKVSPIEGTRMKQEHIESRAAVTPATEVTSKEMLIADNEPEKYTRKEQTLKDSATTKEEKRTTISAKMDIKDEHIKGEALVTPTKIIEEMHPSQEIIEKEKYKPATEFNRETKSYIDMVPTVREPSVTDKTKPNIIEKKTPDYKTDSYPEYGGRATKKWESEVEQSHLEVDVRYIPLQEVETISRKKGEAQGLQSIKQTKVLSLEPVGKENVSLQESSRGIKGKMLCVTEHVFLI
ncbi:titin-like [Thunnus thynnus]|uniref:titin-like n=1 Tax=Thunnus thynnus TaxID=8237 RepID=UPI003527AF67